MPYYKNFERDNKKTTRNVGLSTSGQNYNKYANNLSKTERLMEGIGDWCSYYRDHPEVFVEEYLGVKLKPFQKVLLYCMIKYNYTMFLASRGSGKTFLTALYCLTRCVLYPGSKIVIASGKNNVAFLKFKWD